MIHLNDPRHRLLETATPLQRLSRLEARTGRAGLYLKRDDQMDIAFGGNKLRSLEFWLGAALAEGADMLLVAGGAMSNLCRLTAATAAMAGLDCVVFHNAPADAASRDQAFLNRLFGAELRFLGAVGEDEREAAMRQAEQEFRAAGRRPYLVGDAVVGALGYVLAAEELWNQARAAGLALRHVFLAGSMGPTEAGFIFGNALLGLPFAVHLVSVEYEEAELAARTQLIYDGLARHTGCAVPAFATLGVTCHMDWLGAGYGEPTAEAERAILTLARTEGILLEHVYTAKTFAALLALATQGVLPDGEAAAMIHTGGVPALFSQFDLFRSLGPAGQDPASHDAWPR